MDTRGEYGLTLGPDGKVTINPRPDHQVSSYDIYHPGWATDAQQEELALQKAPWISGEFVWTGFDYLGEPTPYKWPSRSSYFGICDLCGFPKDRYYLYKSVWSQEPVVHLLPASWNWSGFEGKAIPVWVYTNADAVELFLNGKSLGVKKFPADVETITIPKEGAHGGQAEIPEHQGPTLHLAWSVPYEAGTLKAVATKDGKVVATDEQITAGPPAALVVQADRSTIDAGGQDLSFIKVTVVDKDGHVCPDAGNEITFQVDGSAATLAGVDNGDPTNHESFRVRRIRRSTGWRSRC